MRTIASTVGLALVVLSIPSVARGDHAHSLQAATSQYHDAVERLERFIDHNHVVSAYSDQYVHRLAVAACALQDAAAHPDDLHCIRAAFEEVAALQSRVEQLLVTHCHRPHPTVVAMWREIAYGLDQVCASIDYLTASTVRSRRIAVPAVASAYPSRQWHRARGYEALPPSPHGSHYGYRSLPDHQPVAGHVQLDASDLRGRLIGSLLTHLLD